MPATKIQNATTNAATKEKVVLAYSGGLDTSVMVKWLQLEKGLDVVAICGNVGQDAEDLAWVEKKALRMGAVHSEALDMREEYAKEVLTKAIKANGLYEDTYPLLSALSRPLIVKHLVEIAHKTGASYIAHGCTGKGNDQVRFETCIHALDPSIKVLAPVREWDLLTREQEMEWAQEHGVPVPTTAAKPYSIDDNLWGRAIECGVLENPWNEPPADIWTMTVDPISAPDQPEEIVVGFEKGVPCSLNGKKMELLPLIVQLNKVCGAHGYGRIDMIEDRVVGIKSHECYECPASLALINMHHALETLCLDHDTLQYKHMIDQQWSKVVYDGLWYSQLKEALDSFCASTQAFVTGEVKAKLYKGSLTVTGRKSAYSLYDLSLATYGDGDSFDRSASKGFIDLHSLPSKTWSGKQGPAHKQAVPAPAGKKQAKLGYAALSA
ncbi:argininosuccinate synthase [Olsenella sp. oral taxon 809 str. F0356]|uniref:argininosuccinate synthase n=1 Tax=Olsenella sp. oral taxon 809 TaxID=661086 RepID=UPI000231F110|nr:argininosuccinate synthase [Olsenella sp. oral taxon 809]EHF02862.1 argininosuccinate synthase [Olsenella sp. oral taxon 809 str. F0356]